MKNTSQRPRPFASLLQGRTIVCVREKVSERERAEEEQETNRTESNSSARFEVKNKIKRKKKTRQLFVFFVGFS